MTDRIAEIWARWLTPKTPGDLVDAAYKHAVPDFSYLLDALDAMTAIVDAAREWKRADDALECFGITRQRKAVLMKESADRALFVAVEALEHAGEPKDG